MPCLPCETEDNAIIDRIIGGDVDAFEKLLTKYRDHVTKIVSRHVPYQEVAEVAHEAFIRMYRSLGRFKKESGFKQWASTIAVRACYDYWRRTYRTREIPESRLSEQHRDWLNRTIADRSENMFTDDEQLQDAREVLAWALNRLNPEDRMVMELVYLEGLSGREAAKNLGWTVTNVKVRAHRLRLKLKQLLLSHVD